MEIKIRYLQSTELAKIDRIAKKIGVSREEFLRRIIRKEIASAGEFLELDSENKIRKALAYQLKESNDLNRILIQQIEELKNGTN
ncbi:ribbon-helix-helix protein, CopG family [Lactococcus lactis]|uniref:Ribbon-helix-helix protein, CopG family n=1 Tax=Lactococcus lactis TaxID=1358 RepID=A0A9X4NIM6_9LACT|nr:ribbon-helix-helix protein, CopG family [Lactococcus lactis]MBK5077000.1 ribbon-helix-helix protein, CopG family [Lactococcus lactis]MDG4984778.1 ribbon-helix-helix protein, CopG family [Lactococcus lactis]WDA70034.1 ribbon-helix-helix protein, CopG family [Lactococcus lactis]